MLFTQILDSTGQSVLEHPAGCKQASTFGTRRFGFLESIHQLCPHTHTHTHTHTEAGISGK